MKADISLGWRDGVEKVRGRERRGKGREKKTMHVSGEIQNGGSTMRIRR